jgi:SAM-dependent methyltransferase
MEVSFLAILNDELPDCSLPLSQHFLPPPLHRLIRTVAAERRDLATIRRVAELKAKGEFESPPCELCGSLSHAKHFRKNGFRIVRCRADGLLFVSPRPVDLAPYYDRAYYASDNEGTYGDYDTHAESMREKWTERLDKLAALLGGRYSLLDVGAATGRFVQLAGASGWKASGVEMSEWATEIASSRNGVDVKLGTLPHPDLRNESFDAVTMWDVIEHLAHPLSVLRAARSILRPGGFVAVSTGSVPHGDARAASGWYYPPWHLFYFSPETMSAMLERAGFVVREIETESPGSPYALMTVWAEVRQSSQTG